MLEWWTRHFDLLIKSGLNKRDISKVTSSKKIKFREGVLEFINLLNKYTIPLVILSSAGLGTDSISMILQREKRLYDNVYVISNSFKWDKGGNAIGINKPIITMMNKDETIIKDFPVFEKIKNRKNVILLGDGLGDLGMIEGFDYDEIITIGFLNEDVDKNLEAYKQGYDVVVVGDGDFEKINGLLGEILG